MSRRLLLRGFAAVLLLAGGLELLARHALPAEESAPPKEWRLERTRGVRRIALTGARRLGTMAGDLERRLRGTEVLDMTSLDDPLAAAARYRPDLVVHGIEERHALDCPSRALAFAVERVRTLVAEDEEETAAIARTRALCELRERSAGFGARVVVAVFPSDEKWAKRVLGSCETADVPAIASVDALLLALANDP